MYHFIEIFLSYAMKAELIVAFDYTIHPIVIFSNSEVQTKKTNPTDWRSYQRGPLFGSQTVLAQKNQL
jgi:hypothetical protein